MRTMPPLSQAPSRWQASAAIGGPGWSRLDQAGAGDLLAVQFAPELGEQRSRLRVRVRAETTQPVEIWREAGYHVLGYDTGELGPGLQCVAEQQTQLAGTQIAAVAAQYRFAAGPESIVVSAEPTLRELFLMAFPGLHQLLGTLQVHRPDGSQFRGLPVPGYTLETADIWAGVGEGAAWEVQEEEITDDDHD